MVDSNPEPEEGSAAWWGYWLLFGWVCTGAGLFAGRILSLLWEALLAFGH